MKDNEGTISWDGHGGGKMVVWADSARFVTGHAGTDDILVVNRVVYSTYIDLSHSDELGWHLSSDEHGRTYHSITMYRLGDVSERATQAAKHKVEDEFIPIILKWLADRPLVHRAGTILQHQNELKRLGSAMQERHDANAVDHARVVELQGMLDEVGAPYMWDMPEPDVAFDAIDDAALGGHPDPEKVQESGDARREALEDPANEGADA